MNGVITVVNAVEKREKNNEKERKKILSDIRAYISCTKEIFRESKKVT